MTHQYTFGFLVPTGRLGLEPDGLVKANLHLTNAALAGPNTKHIQAIVIRAEQGNPPREASGGVWLDLLSRFLEMDDRGNVSYRTV